MNPIQELVVALAGCRESSNCHQTDEFNHHLNRVMSGGSHNLGATIGITQAAALLANNATARAMIEQNLLAQFDQAVSSFMQTYAARSRASYIGRTIASNIPPT